MKDNSMELHAPAKINLSFKILGRRDDGFHEIETLMAPVSLFDRLIIVRGEPDEKVEFVCDDASLPSNADNLVVQAAELFLRSTNTRTGLRIELQKNIPHGAGLGGGSSDAASVLLGLNELLATRLDEKKLAELAAEIGSDVPFFIYRSAAMCRGRGELVTPTSLPRKLSLLLLKPGFGVPTPWAYSRWKDSKEWPDIDYSPQSFRDFTFVNDLERPVFEKYLFLARLKMWLRKQPEVGVAILSGSGSTVFAVLREGANGDSLGKRARDELDPELWTCACETL
ncbi:MAG: 4-(cytidine 5'-diphospho)-2-C-methyl-D-erythritol kinase [Chthoniobacterales bacterium]